MQLLRRKNSRGRVYSVGGAPVLQLKDWLIEILSVGEDFRKTLLTSKIFPNFQVNFRQRLMVSGRPGTASAAAWYEANTAWAKALPLSTWASSTSP